jgi:transcriptional regulator of acetoin/glycerol metabolism
VGASTTARRAEVRVDPALIEHLLSRTYETNVRELDTLLWQAMAATPDDTVVLTVELRKESRPQLRSPEPSADEIRAAVKAAQGSVASEARALGMTSRFALYRLLKKHGVAGDAKEESEK